MQAIKKLQARGLSLVKVQESLAGADEKKLVRWAGLPRGFWDTVPAAAETEPTSPGELLAPLGPKEENGCEKPNRAVDRFWAVAPAAPPAEEESSMGPEPSISPRTALHLSITPGVTLVIEGADWRRVDDGALNELTPALEDLLAALRRAGLALPDASQTQTAEPHPKHPNEESEETT